MDKQPEDRLKALEARLEKLEASRKDGWDKFQILAALLIPAAVAFSGYYFSQTMADAQIKSAQAMADSQQASEERRAQASQAISQAELVATFMKSLLSADAVEKDLAIRAVLLALPESGPQLVAAVQAGAGDAKTRDAATVALRDRRDKLVNDVYAEDPVVRQNATDQLVVGFRNDPLVVDTIARQAQKENTNANGVYNSALVLRALPAGQLQANHVKVQQFIKIANQGGEKTKAIAKQIHLKSEAQQ